MPSPEELGYLFDLKNLVIVFTWIGIATAIFLLFVTVRKGLDYLRTKDPVETLRKDMEIKFEEHDKSFDDVNQKLHTDNERFKAIDMRFIGIEERMDRDAKLQKKAAQRSDENFKVLATSISAMLGHMITGNGYKELQETQQELTEYFIKGGKSKEQD